MLNGKFLEWAREHIIEWLAYKNTTTGWPEKKYIIII